ncbi:S-layer homology domain-containing protein [Paenibacillus sp. FSL R5-808]|uniref:S-layer homology domain-containing protein n=1 Tax=Paenibacillus sp. FSL R5-808 TaxID=1227076 RepID=UPI0004B02258|nr:S-layer homology domain-containing protein [Paenibacillus sp. FSL R5-808]
MLSIRRSRILKIVLIILLIAAFFAAPESTSADTSLKNVETGRLPYSVAVNPVTNKIYVVNKLSHNMTIIDGATNKSKTIEVGKNPEKVSVNPVTNKIYVTLGEQKVAVIDGESDTVTTKVAVGSSPTSVEVNTVTNKIYVVNVNSNTVTIIDGMSNETTEVKVGNKPVAVAVNSVTNKAYVANQVDDTVTVIEGSTYKKTLVTDVRPSRVSVNPVTNKIYVNNIYSSTVSVIDGASDTIMSSEKVGSAPWGGAVNPVTNKIYVANTSSNNVTIIDGATDKAMTTVGAGYRPEAVAVNPVTNKIYVANEDDKVTVIDGESDTAMTTIAAGDFPVAVAVNPVTNKIYVANQMSDTVTVIDGASYTPTTVEAEDGPISVAVNPVTNKIYVANIRSHSVTVIDGASNETTTLAVGVNPTAVAVNTVTNKIYVTNSDSNTITVIDGVSNETTTIATGIYPAKVVVNPVTNKIYVANSGSNSVTVIDGASNETTTVDAGAGPSAIDVNPVTNKIYVSNTESHNVTVINGTNNETTTVATGYGPGAIAVNPVTNKIYVTSDKIYYVTVIDGASNETTTVATGNVTNAVAVNPVTNKIYVTNNFIGNVTVIDGENNGTTTVAVGYGPRAVAVNPVTNKIYVANIVNDTMSIIDGESNTSTAVLAGKGPVGVAVNPVTNKVYVANIDSNNVSTFDFAGRTTNPLTVAISPLSGNIAYGPDTTFTFEVSNTYSPYSPEVQGVYFQLDHTEGAWVKASPSGGNWTGTLTSLPYGQHVLYVLALEAQGNGVSAGIADAYAFNVLPENMISPAIASFDKYAEAASYTDVTTTWTLYGNTLSSITSGTETLVPGTDYTVSGGNTVTIKKEYLAAQSVGTVNLTFTFSTGAAQTLSITVSDSTPPGTPTGLTARAGNEQVELSWSGVPGTVTYSVYGGTASGVYDSTPIAIVDGSTTSYTATGLTNGTRYYFAMTASNESGDSGYSNEASATPRTGSTSPNSSGGAPSTTNPPFNHNPINVPKTQNNIHVTINGQKPEGITTDAITTDNGLTVQSVTIDAAKLSEALAKDGDKPVIVIAVNSSADKVTVALTGEAVESLKNKQAIIEVHTPNGNYKLPATELGIDRFSAQLGDPVVLKDVLVHVDIAKSGIDKIRLLENTSKKGRFTVMSPPVDFAITASYKGKTVNLDKFTSYVEREIPLPEGVDPNKVTTAIVLEANGRVRHVPTNLTLRDGKYYSVASSMTNSTYSLIWHPMRFADVEGHWSQAAVNDMASRMVVNGVDTTHYLPNAAITRAEFAAIIVRALGLTNNGVKSVFEDVKSGDWYAGAVATAQEYGITAGDEDGTFHPAETITREEAMVMIARAMKLAGLDTSLSVAEADAALSKFADRASVAIWAQQAVAATVKMGLVSGSDAGLQPKSDITRAETAVIVQRMLEKAGLIDNKHSE